MIILSFALYSVIPVFAEESPEGWERLSDMPEVRSEMKSVVIEGKIYSIGGLNNRDQATNTVFILDTKDNSWHTGTPMPVSLHHAGAATYENKIYVVGGYLDGWIPTNSLLIYDLEIDAWSKGQDMPTPRGALVK